jgi:tripartite-type tricarboxylate transporter receptor subunit TctC
MGGEVDFSFGSATRRLDNVLAGKLRALAIIGDERLDQLPEVKSTTELGYEFPYYPGYRTIFAPAGTPQEIVDYLREATANLVEDPSFISMIRRTGATVDYMDGPEFEKIWDEEIKNLKVLVEEVVEE